MRFNEITFLRRSITEKIREDKEVLQIYYKHLKQVIEGKEHYSIFHKFYAEKLKGILDIIGEALKSMEDIDFLNHFTVFRVAKVHDIIRYLTEFCMLLDRAFRHRSPLFNGRLKIYAAHYAFEPFYKTLISCDAILYKSIDRSERRNDLFLMSYFGERGPETLPYLVLIPEYLCREGFTEDVNVIRIGFVTIPRHMHLHSRCTVDNIHESMHNLIRLSYYQSCRRDGQFYKKFNEFSKIYIYYTGESRR